MTNEQRAVENRIELHARAALSLLPSNLIVGGLSPKPQDIQLRADTGDWRQVIYLIRSIARANDFSPELRWQLDVGFEYAQLADRLGTRRAILRLSSAEKQVIRECLLASALGPFFPDWEFPTLFGLKRDVVLDVGMTWPEIHEDSSAVGRAVNNAFNNLLYYPHRKWDRWRYHVSVPPWWAWEVYREWRELTGRSARPRRLKNAANAYFENFE